MQNISIFVCLFVTGILFCQHWNVLKVPILLGGYFLLEHTVMKT